MFSPHHNIQQYIWGRIDTIYNSICYDNMFNNAFKSLLRVLKENGFPYKCRLTGNSQFATNCYTVVLQARRKQLQIGGGGGTHNFFLKFKKKIIFFFFNFFFFFFGGGGGAYLCKLLGGGGTAPLFLRPCFVLPNVQIFFVQKISFATFGVSIDDFLRDTLVWATAY